MKRKRLAALLMAGCISLTAFPLLLAGGVAATSMRETTLTDNFDGEKLSSSWSADTGVEQKAVYSCMRIKDMTIWQPAIMLQTYEVKGGTSFTVSFDISVKEQRGWLGFFLGAPSTGVGFYESEAMWMMSRDSVSFWVGEGSNIVEDQEQALASSPLTGATGENIVSVYFDVTAVGDASDRLFDVEFSFGPQGEDPTTSQTYQNVSACTYMGFASMDSLFVDIMNFKITEDGEEVFADDFSSGSIVYPGSSDPSKNWKVTHTYGQENVFVGPLKRIVFDGVAEGKLYSNVALACDTRSDKLFEMEFTLFPEALNDNAYFGVGFGLSGAGDYADSVNMIALRKEGTGVKFVKLINGQETAALSDATFTMEEVGLNDAEGAEILLTGYHDGQISVQLAGKTVTFGDMKFDGHFAVATAKPFNTEVTANNIAIDDFSLSVYTYRAGTGSDMAINFEGVREFEELGFTYKEHYYNRSEWYLSGSGISLAPYRSEYDNDYLQMVNATGKVAFGPKNQMYSDFIVRFSVSMLTTTDTPTNTAVGIALGKPSLDTANEDATCVWFNYNGSSTAISGMNVQTEDGATSVPCDINLWADTTTLYNVVMIVSDRTVEVYVKRAEDDISELGILRAKFTNVNTYGYVALTCNTLDGKRGNCKLTDFSITNIGFGA